MILNHIWNHRHSDVYWCLNDQLVVFKVGSMILTVSDIVLIFQWHISIKSLSILDYKLYQMTINLIRVQQLANVDFLNNGRYDHIFKYIFPVLWLNIMNNMLYLYTITYYYTLFSLDE